MGHEAQRVFLRSICINVPCKMVWRQRPAFVFGMYPVQNSVGSSAIRSKHFLIVISPGEDQDNIVK